jgi:IS66 Orf2 like protein
MLRPNASDQKVYLHRAPIDMRKQRNGLAAIVKEAMRQDPFQRAFFLFTNKKCDALKILTWDVNGFCKPSTQNPWYRFRVETTLLPMAPMVRS